MKRTTFSATCTAKTRLADDIYELRFTKPADFTFEAGQYLMWSVPLVSNPEDTQYRAYSIVSPPSHNELVFVLKLFDDGRASDWVRNNVDVGATLQMYGPFGGFTLVPDAEELVLIATSTGVAPYLSMIEQNLYTKNHIPVHILFSVKNEQELFYIEYLEDLRTKHPAFEYTLTLTSPTTDWQGSKGRVQLYVPNLLLKYPKAHVYACGNPIMTKAMKQLLREEFNLPKERVKVEGYI